MRTSLLPRRRLPLVAEEEFPGFYSLRREMNHLFDNFFRGTDWWQAPEIVEEELSRFTPSVDVRESDKEVIVSAELPGMAEKDIDVSLSDDTLVLRGEKKEEKEETAKGHYRMERSYGLFHRSIPLPYEVEKDKVEAVFKNGVVTVTLPKSKEAQKEVKKIAIKTT